MLNLALSDLVQQVLYPQTTQLFTVHTHCNNTEGTVTTFYDLFLCFNSKLNE